MKAAARMVVVGDVADPHVREVVAQLPGTGVVVIDGVSASSTVVSLSADSTALKDMSGETVELGVGVGVHGWFRRLAPAGWDHDIRLGSRQAAILASRLTLLAAVVRDPAIEWLTSVDDLFAAENKIVQYRAAAAAGARVPEFVVTGDRNVLRDHLGEKFVLKPLGPGDYQDEQGRHNVIYTRECDSAELDSIDLQAAPFLSQRTVRASAHLRVVTVGRQAWVAELNSAQLPLDWRAHGPAHHSFRSSSRWTEVESVAVAVASKLRVGFSSQDWLVDDSGPLFIDLNPAGQWMFLPEEVSKPATMAICDWLRGEK